MLFFFQRSAPNQKEGCGALTPKLRLRGKAAGKTRKDYAYSDFEYTDIASSVVFTVDRTARDKNSMVYKSDKNAVKDYLTFGETSKVYIYTRSGYPRLTVVYK